MTPPKDWECPRKKSTYKFRPKHSFFKKQVIYTETNWEFRSKSSEGILSPYNPLSQQIYCVALPYFLHALGKSLE